MNYKENEPNLDDNSDGGHFGGSINYLNISDSESEDINHKIVCSSSESEENEIEESEDESYSYNSSEEESEKDIDTVSKNGFKNCGFMTKNGTRCQVIGKCRFHQDIYNNGTTRKTIVHKTPTTTRDTLRLRPVYNFNINNNNNNHNNIGNKNSNNNLIGTKRKINSSSDESDNEDKHQHNNKNDREGELNKDSYKFYRNISYTQIMNSKPHITKSEVFELTRKILHNFNFYKFISKSFSSFGYRISLEFTRFIVIKNLFDNGDIGDKRSIKSHHSILQAPPLISEFWANIVIHTLDYERLCKIIGNMVRFDPHQFELPLLYQKISFAKTLAIYLKFFDEIDDDIWVFK